MKCLWNTILMFSLHNLAPSWGSRELSLAGNKSFWLPRRNLNSPVNLPHQVYQKCEKKSKDDDNINKDYELINNNSDYPNYKLTG